MPSAPVGVGVETGDGTGEPVLPAAPSPSGTLTTGGGSALLSGDLSEFLEKYGEGSGAFYYGLDKASYKEDIPFRTGGQEAAGYERGNYGNSAAGARRLIARAEIFAETSGDLHNAVQAFKAAHSAGGQPKKLYVRRFTTDTDSAKQAQYIWATVENIGGIDYQSPLTSADIEVAFVCYDPLFYNEPVRQTPSIGVVIDGSDVVYTVPYAGLAAGLPAVVFTAVGLGGGGIVTIGNAQTGQYIQVTPDGNATYTIDCRLQEVRTDGVLYEWWDGDWFDLTPLSDNNLRIVTNDYLMIENVSFSWNDTEY